MRSGVERELRLVDGDTWEVYPGLERAGISGNLLVSRRALPSPSLPRAKRRLLAWLPPAYGSGRQRFPVVYMHDGHNLFDESASYSGAWRVDVTMADLASRGVEAIVIGIPNAGEARVLEYSPWADPEHGGGDGARYLRFLVDTVKPFVDQSLDTSPDRTGAGLAGSSLGANVSLYGLLAHPDVFGFAACLSPAFWFAAEGWSTFFDSAVHSPDRIYLDVGGNEVEGNPDMSQMYIQAMRKTESRLIAMGYGPDEMQTLFVPDGTHIEAAWSDRIGEALRFVLPSP